jgi:hypothetical protein
MMTLFAPHETETLLTQLDDRRSRAWLAYASELDGRAAEDYEIAERDAWATLQVELRAVEAERSDIIAFTE